VAGPWFRQLHFLPITYVLIIVFLSFLQSFRCMSAPISSLLSTNDSLVGLHKLISRTSNAKSPNPSFHTSNCFSIGLYRQNSSISLYYLPPAAAATDLLMPFELRRSALPCLAFFSLSFSFSVRNVPRLRSCSALQLLFCLCTIW
jgi:hypothetical protein